MIDSNKRVAILLRGESIRKIPEIADEFDLCFLINWRKMEFDLFGDYIMNKNIILYSNLKHTKYYRTEMDIFEKYNIDSFGYPYPYNMLGKDRLDKFIEKLKNHGVSNFYPLPEEYIDELILRPRNTGITCILYCAGVIKFKEIWICGLDFYFDEYKYVDEIKKSNRREVRLNNMLYRFTRYMKEFKDIRFNVVSNYHDEFFSKFPNVYTYKEGVFKNE